MIRKQRLLTLLCVVAGLALLGSMPIHAQTTSPVPGQKGDQGQAHPLDNKRFSPSHYGSAPYAPPDANDVTFVSDIGPGLDTGCTFNDSSPLIIDLYVTRYPGDINQLKAMP